MTSEPLAGRVSAPTGEPDPWRNSVTCTDRGGTGYVALINETRAYLDALASASAPSAISERLAGQLEEVTAALREWSTEEGDAPIGTRLDLPGRGHPLLLPFVADEWTDRAVSGRVVFGQIYLGGNGAAHGGMVTLLFDEVLG